MTVELIYPKFCEKYRDVPIGAGVSAVVIYDNLLYFVVDPVKYWRENETGYHLTFGCVGGTVEEGESYLEALDKFLGFPEAQDLGRFLQFTNATSKISLPCLGTYLPTSHQKFFLIT